MTVISTITSLMWCIWIIVLFACCETNTRRLDLFLVCWMACNMVLSVVTIITMCVNTLANLYGGLICIQYSS